MQQQNFYIGSQNGSSGICLYTHDFYELILKKKGYIFLDSNQSLDQIRSLVLEHDRVHMELGIFQKNEIRILLGLLDAGYTNISITLHDPPLLKYPFYEFKNSFANKISKFYDIWINRFRKSLQYMHQLKAIYVLTQLGLESVKARYKITNAYFLPHIINEKSIRRNSGTNRNFMYVGFIGKNKGIGYALELHRNLLKRYPDAEFYVAGTALGNQKKYLNALKASYRQNVHFLDYVPEEKMDALFQKACFSFILFKPYRFFFPVSGSALYNLKKGNIVFTNNVNAIPEIIQDGETGFYLTADINRDMDIISKVFENRDLQEKIRDTALNHLKNNHASAVVEQYFHY